MRGSCCIKCQGATALATRRWTESTIEELRHNWTKSVKCLQQTKCAALYQAQTMCWQSVRTQDELCSFIINLPVTLPASFEANKTKFKRTRDIVQLHPKPTRQIAYTFWSQQTGILKKAHWTMSSHTKMLWQICCLGRLTVEEKTLANIKHKPKSECPYVMVQPSIHFLYFMLILWYWTTHILAGAIRVEFIIPPHTRI